LKTIKNINDAGENKTFYFEFRNFTIFTFHKVIELDLYEKIKELIFGKDTKKNNIIKGSGYIFVHYKDKNWLINAHSFQIRYTDNKHIKNANYNALLFLDLKYLNPSSISRGSDKIKDKFIKLLNEEFPKYSSDTKSCILIPNMRFEKLIICKLSSGFFPLPYANKIKFLIRPYNNKEDLKFLCKDITERNRCKKYDIKASKPLSYIDLIPSSSNTKVSYYDETWLSSLHQEAISVIIKKFNMSSFELGSDSDSESESG